MERKYALIIGNGEYLDPSLTRLKAPDVDVVSLAAALRDPKIGGFDDVKEMVNQPYTVVSKEISKFFNDKKREDMLLMYFSGHGVQDSNGRLYLTVKDSEKDYLDITSIPASFISSKLTECRSKRKILILDCCHSGAWQVGAKGDTAAVTADTFQGYGHVVMTASDKTEYALEGDQVVDDVSLSLFTNYLLEGLKTGQADRLNDGWVDVDELFDYARDRVISQTGKQKPKIWKFDTEGELKIAKNPNPKEVDLPFSLKAAITSDFHKLRLESIDQLVILLNGSVPKLADKAAEALQQMAANDDSFMVRQRAADALKGKQLSPLSGEELAVSEKTKRLEALYASATSAIQAGRWEEAQDHLLGIEKEEPGYKDVRQLLSQASAGLERIQKEKLAALYGQAVQAAGAKNWAEAQRLFRQLEQMAPGYQDVRQRLDRIEAEIQRQQTQKDQQERLDGIYDRAMEAMQASQWVEAQRFLLQLEMESPGYRDVRRQLNKVNDLVRAIQQPPAPGRPVSRSKTLLVGIAIGVILVLCACAFLVYYSSSSYGY